MKAFVCVLFAILVLAQAQEGMEDVSVHEVSRESWDERIFDSLFGFVFGLFLFLLGFPLLTFAEGTFVHREKCLHYARQLLSKRPSHDEETHLMEDQTDHNKLIHVTGFVSCAGDAKDEDFNVSVKDALVLKRHVEMFQYYERSSTQTKKDTFGGGSETKTTYSLETGWFSHIQILTHIQGYSNPMFPFVSDSFESSDIVITEGRTEKDDTTDTNNNHIYKLARSQIDRLDSNSRYPVTEKIINSFPEHTITRLNKHLNLNNLDELLSKSTTNAKGEIILRNNNNTNKYDNNNSIGDLKITYKIANEGNYSLVSGQDKKMNSFRPFQVDKYGEFELPYVCGGCCPGPVGWVINLLESSAKINTNRIDLFEKGFYLMLDPIATIADLVGPIGTLIRVGTFMVSFIVGVVAYLLTLSFAWSLYHPLKAGLLFFMAAAVLYAAQWYSLANYHH